MSEEVPRRLRRFHREKEEKPAPKVEVRETPKKRIVREMKERKQRQEMPAQKEEKKPGFFGERFTGKVEKPDEGKTKKIAARVGKEVTEMDVDIAAESVFRQMEKKKKAKELALKKIRSFTDEHKRYPREHEYTDMAESVYEQLKREEKREESRKKTRELLEKPKKISEKEEKPGKEGEELSPRERVLRRRRGRGRAEEVKGGKIEKKEAEEQDIVKAASEIGTVGLEEKPGEVESMEKLFAEEKTTEAEVQKAEGELGKLDFSEEGLAGEEELKTIGAGEEEKPAAKCPKCSSETENIIYCPKCGSGFCKNCAKKAEAVGDKMKYSCPHCGNEFKVSKR